MDMRTHRQRFGAVGVIVVASAVVIAACSEGVTTNATITTDTSATPNAARHCDAAPGATCPFDFESGTSPSNRSNGTPPGHSPPDSRSQNVADRVTGLTPNPSYYHHGCVAPQSDLSTYTCVGRVGSAQPTTSSTTRAASAAVTTAVGLSVPGYGTTSAADMAGTFTSVRIDTTVRGAETPDTYFAHGIPSVVLIPNTTAGEYTAAGVESIAPNAWAQYALSYFKSKCHASARECPALEVLNEPYGSWFWGRNAGDQTEATAYGKLVKTTYTTFHAAFEANSPLILAAMYASDCFQGAGTHCVSHWYKEITAGVPGLTSYYDGAVAHPYGGGGSTLPSLSALGDRDWVASEHTVTGKPIWVTEVGWQTEVNLGPDASSLQWTETGQADNIYSFVTWAKSTGYVAAVEYYTYRDGGGWYGVECSIHGGLQPTGSCGANADGTKKPAWRAFGTAVRGQPCDVCDDQVPSTTTS